MKLFNCIAPAEPLLAAFKKEPQALDECPSYPWPVGFRLPVLEHSHCAEMVECREQSERDVVAIRTVKAIYVKRPLRFYHHVLNRLGACFGPVKRVVLSDIVGGLHPRCLNPDDLHEVTHLRATIAEYLLDVWFERETQRLSIVSGDERVLGVELCGTRIYRGPHR